MKEPTREQIKEAFKKTIERWEKIVERPSYYHESHCALCRVYDETDTCHKYCPIRDYGMADEHRVCSGTPYHNFVQDKTPANALAELNFLRKVYIWWMEEREKDKDWESITGYKKEEKKEEWEDITDEVTWKTEGACDEDYWLVGYYDNRLIFITAEETVIELNSKSDEENYKTEMTDIGAFRILKKI